MVAQDARNMFGVGTRSYPPCMANNRAGTKLGAASVKRLLGDRAGHEETPDSRTESGAV